MQITKIELAGRPSKQTGVPICFATILAVPGRTVFNVILCMPDGGERTHLVDATCREDIFSMAQCLHFQLEGRKGSNSEIHDYYRLLQYFEQ
jgi:hypothetical protein